MIIESYYSTYAKWNKPFMRKVNLGVRVLNANALFLYL